MSRKALPLEEYGATGNSGPPWDILTPVASDGECAGMATTQLHALKKVSPLPAFKLSLVSLKESLADTTVMLFNLLHKHVLSLQFLK